MIKEFVNLLHINAFGLTVLVFFAVLFLSGLFWIFRKSAGQHYQRIANLPLEED